MGDPMARLEMRRLAVIGGAVLLAGCYGGLSSFDPAAADDEPGASDAGEEGDGSGDDDGGGDDAGEAAEVDAPTLRRLTRAEFTHAVHDLLGPVALGPVETDSSQEGFFSVGAARVALSPAGVAAYEQALDLATAEAFADPTSAASLVACMPADTADTACMRASIEAFGRRAWRRPLEPDETDRYLSIAQEVGTETGDPVAALRHALWGVLQSPYFLYRVELGSPSPDDDGRVKFSGWEMASRLSFTLWSTVPDDALLDAAESGELSVPEGIEAQAERMLADPRARQGVENFVAELYELWLLDEQTKDAELYPQWTPTLKEVMREELLARVDDVVFENPGDFLSLYDGKKVFVDNELARLYGLPEIEPDAFRVEMLPESDPRAGLIGSALVLAMNSLPARTSATKRGQFISEILLCRTVPPPPPTVDVNLDDDDGDGGPVEHKTLREKLEPHRTDPTCAACHDITDPLGLALEHFDTTGQYRETDLGLAIDASGELDGVAFTDAADLAVLLREHPDAASCLVKKLYTYTAGRRPFAEESDALADLVDELAAEGGRFDRLLLSLVTHDDFRFAHPEESVLAPDAGESP
jgi:hypothetical protein